MKLKRKRIQDSGQEEDPRLPGLELLSRTPSLSAADTDIYAAFPFLTTSSNELDGGFLSLEEIDEADYGLDIPKPAEQKSRRKRKKLEKSWDGVENDVEKLLVKHQQQEIEDSYMPEIMRRISLARQIDKISRKDSQEKAKKSWLEKHAESLELDVENSDSEEERVSAFKKKKASTNQLKKLQQGLKMQLSCPLQPKPFHVVFWQGLEFLLSCNNNLKP